MKKFFIVLLFFISCDGKKDDNLRKIAFTALIFQQNPTSSNSKSQNCILYESNYSITSSDTAKNGKTYDCKFSNNALSCMDNTTTISKQFFYNSMQDFILERKTIGLTKAMKVLEDGKTAINVFDSTGKLVSTEYTGNSDPRVSQEKRLYSNFDIKGRPIDSTYSYSMQPSIGFSGGNFNYSEKYTYDDGNKKYIFEKRELGSAVAHSKEFNSDNILSTEVIKNYLNTTLNVYNLKSTQSVCF